VPSGDAGETVGPSLWPTCVSDMTQRGHKPAGSSGESEAPQRSHLAPSGSVMGSAFVEGAQGDRGVFSSLIRRVFRKFTPDRLFLRGRSSATLSTRPVGLPPQADHGRTRRTLLFSATLFTRPVGLIRHRRTTGGLDAPYFSLRPYPPDRWASSATGGPLADSTHPTFLERRCSGVGWVKRRCTPCGPPIAAERRSTQSRPPIPRTPPVGLPPQADHWRTRPTLLFRLSNGGVGWAKRRCTPCGPPISTHATASLRERWCRVGQTALHAVRPTDRGRTTFHAVPPTHTANATGGPSATGGPLADSTHPTVSPLERRRRVGQTAFHAVRPTDLD
jgi:hypothetical protein